MSPVKQKLSNVIDHKKEKGDKKDKPKKEKDSVGREKIIHIPVTTLYNTQKMPVLGFGTWLGLDDNFKFLVEDIPKLVEALSYAIDIGYRHIDTAHLYRVEPEIGDVIAAKIHDGVCKREDIFVCTKVWQHCHRPADVVKSIKDSLKRLKLEYVDLVLMHWPMSISVDGVDEKIDYVESWKGFQEALKQNLTRSIGVSNFNEDQMQRLCANCKVKPAVLQIEVNLTLGQPDLVDWCKAHNIAVVAYSPFGTMVPSRNIPNSPPPKLDDPVMVAIARKHGKTVTQVALRYLYQRGLITIPKTLTKERALENATIFDFELSNAECMQIAKFDIGYRCVRPVFWQNYTNYPFDKVEVEKMEIPLALRVWRNGANQDID